METKEKQWLMIWADYNTSFRVLKAASPEDFSRIEVSSDGEMVAVTVWQIFLVCRLKVSGGLPEWSYSNRHEDCPHVSCCGDLSKVYIKLSNFSFRGFEKKAALVLNDSKSKSERKIGNIRVESCSQILEESGRIQDLVQFTGRKQNLKNNEQN